MAETGTRSEMPLLNLVVGMERAARQMEKACFTGTNEVIRLMKQVSKTNLSLPNQVFSYQVEHLSDYTAGVNTGSGHGRKPGEGDADHSGRQSNAQGQSRTDRKGTVSAARYLADNRIVMLPEGHRMMAVTNALTEMLDWLGGRSSTSRKQTEPQSRMTAAAGFDGASSEVAGFMQKAMNSSGYEGGKRSGRNGIYDSHLGIVGSGQGIDVTGFDRNGMVNGGRKDSCFMGSNLGSPGFSDVTGQRRNPAALKGSEAAGAVRKSDYEDVRWMRKLAERDYVVPIVQTTVAPNIKVEFTGSINKETDIDSVMARVGELMDEQIAAAPEGVYR